MDILLFSFKIQKSILFWIFQSMGKIRQIDKKTEIFSLLF